MRESMKYTKIKTILALAMAVTVATGEEAKQEKSWSVDTEAGYYEKRISGGQVGATDAPYVKAMTDIGNFKGLSLVGSLELVEANNDELHGSIGTALDTRIGVIDTRFIAHLTEGKSTTFELAGTYGFNAFDFLDTSFNLALENGGSAIDGTTDVVYTPSLNVSKTFHAGPVALKLGGEYGHSFNLDQDFEYLHLYSRVSTVINEKYNVYAQYNWVDSSDVVEGGTTFAQGADFGGSFQAGVSISF